MEEKLEYPKVKSFAKKDIIDEFEENKLYNYEGLNYFQT